MDAQTFETYLRQTQQTAQRLSTDPSALLDIIQLIEKHKLLIENHHQDWDEFFKGESTFYSGQYEKSLQHYLLAKEVPHYHFFCFRTSCFVARARGNQEQAVNFAKKALKLNANDEMLKQFLHDLNTVATPKPVESIPKISLGEKEIAELASIFEEPSSQSEELFAREFAEPVQATGLSDAEEVEEEKYESRALAVETSSFLADAETRSSPSTSSDLFQESEHFVQKLYAMTRHTPASQETSLSALKRLAEEPLITQKEERFESSSYKDELENRISSFQNLQSKRLKEYLDYTHTRSSLIDNAFFVLNGWNKQLAIQAEAGTSSYPHTQSMVLTEQARQSTGGMFVRWHGVGVVINPGAGFLDYFHEQGFSLRDIQAVIVTRDDQASYTDVKAIYALNNKLNKISDELQIIHYYLNQKAYQELTSILKPNFKQARHTVHSLELFLDSPDVEKIEIGKGVTLHYFLATSQDSTYKHSHAKHEHHAKTTLGIRLEFHESTDDQTPVRLGYVSGASWSPLLAHHLGLCEVLVTGFGNTSPNDYHKVNYQEDSLGYYGLYSLLEEIAPRLLVATEFGGREGDIRLEIVKKLRQDIRNNGRKALQESVILPGDVGLCVDLKSLKIHCSVTSENVDPDTVHIAKSADSFGRLLYLSSTCYL